MNVKRYPAALLALAAMASALLGQPMSDSATAPSTAAPSAAKPAAAASAAAPAPGAEASLAGPNQPPAPSALPQPKIETLKDLRANVAQGKLKGTPALCDRLRGAYEAERANYLGSAQTNPGARQQAAVVTLMACYCIYAKAQTLALTNDLAGAQAALADARNFETQFPEFTIPKIKVIIQQLDVITSGLIQEKSGDLKAALQTYLPATYESGADEAPIATGRLAMIELKQGHIEKAQSWAYIHADDPTSQYVLAQISAQKKNLMVAQKHAVTAIGLVQKQLANGKEYMPVYFVETPAIRALSKKLPPLSAAPKIPTPKPPAQPLVPDEAPVAPAPKPGTPKAAPAGDSMAPGMMSTNPKME